MATVDEAAAWEALPREEHNSVWDETERNFWSNIRHQQDAEHSKAEQDYQRSATDSRVKISELTGRRSQLIETRARLARELAKVEEELTHVSKEFEEKSERLERIEQDYRTGKQARTETKQKIWKTMRRFFKEKRGDDPDKEDPQDLAIEFFGSVDELRGLSTANGTASQEADEVSSPLEELDDAEFDDAILGIGHHEETSQDKSTPDTLVQVIDSDGNVVGPVERIDAWNQWVEAIMDLEIRRPVKIRRGRRFNNTHLATIYERTEAKGVKWLSCMIQATGEVQSKKCQCCEKNQGAFDDCVIIGGDLFQKCGNCEWNRQGCHGASGDTLDKFATRRASKPRRQREPREVRPEIQEELATVEVKQRTDTVPVSQPEPQPEAQPKPQPQPESQPQPEPEQTADKQHELKKNLEPEPQPAPVPESETEPRKASLGEQEATAKAHQPRPAQRPVEVPRKTYRQPTVRDVPEQSHGLDRETAHRHREESIPDFIPGLTPKRMPELINKPTIESAPRPMHSQTSQPPSILNPSSSTRPPRIYQPAQSSHPVQPTQHAQSSQSLPPIHSPQVSQPSRPVQPSPGPWHAHSTISVDTTRPVRPEIVHPTTELDTEDASIINGARNHHEPEQMPSPKEYHVIPGFTAANARSRAVSAERVDRPTPASIPNEASPQPTENNHDEPLEEITRETLILKHNGVVYTYPECVEGVPLEKIDENHPYWEPSWQNVKTVIEPQLARWREKYHTATEGPGKAEKGGSSKYQIGRQVNRGVKILDFHVEGEISPYQLFSKKYIQSGKGGITSYDTLFRLSETLSELAKFKLDITPTEWMRQRLFELSQQYGSNFNLPRTVHDFYHDPKLAALRRKHGFKNIGRPSGLKVRRSQGSPSSTPKPLKKRKSMHSVAGTPRDNSFTEQSPTNVETPIGPDNSFSSQVNKRPRHSPSTPLPVHDEFDYENISETDSLSGGEITERDFRLHQVKTRKYTSATQVTQYWHWQKSDECFEHQVLKEVKPPSWALYKKSIDFHVGLREIAEVVWNIAALRIHIVMQRGPGMKIDKKDGMPRGDVMASFIRDRTMRRFLKFCREKRVRMIKEST